jgi:hypothetical protein
MGHCQPTAPSAQKRSIPQPFLTCLARPRKTPEEDIVGARCGITWDRRDILGGSRARRHILRAHAFRDSRFD